MRIPKAIQTFGLMAAMSIFMHGHASGQAWSAKPVRIVTTFSPGSAGDIAARLIAEDLPGAFGQPFIVDNKPGNSGILAAGQTTNSVPDGYALFPTTTTANSVAPYLFKNLPFDPIKDFTAISRVYSFPFVLIVNSVLQFQTAADLLTYSPAHPNSVNCG